MVITTDTRLEDLTLIKYLDEIKSPFLPKIVEVYDEIKSLLNTRIPQIFPHYTLHDTGHSFRIIEYMSKLVKDYKELDQLEITIMIYSALLHDIGMATSEEDVLAIKADSFHPCETKFSVMKKLMNNDDTITLQEYIRRIHASLSARHIREKLKDKFLILNNSLLNFTNELAIICESHTEDYDWIKANLKDYEVRGDYSFNPQFIATILRLADILDIDSNRTPYKLYEQIAPKGISKDEWNQHFIISNNDKILIDEKTQQKKIFFHGEVRNPHIHRKLLNYLNWIQDELAGATSLVKNMASKYDLFYSNIIENHIQPIGYDFSDFKMKLDFKAVSALLMGEKIYGHKSLGLRELIQNSIDACKIRQETENSNISFDKDPYLPRIKVVLNKNTNRVIIKDNGIGMTYEIIRKHFLNIGVSYYSSRSFLLKDYNYKPIGNFGIGFLACFMLSNTVQVISRNFKSKDKYTISFEKGDEWISLTECEDVIFEGTEIILEYDTFINAFENNLGNISSFLSSYFVTDEIQIELIDNANASKNFINNSLSFYNSFDEDMFRINFQEYLNDVSGFAFIKKEHNPFIRKFEDICSDEHIFIYDEIKGLLELESIPEISIDDYLNNNEIKYLSVTIVPSFISHDFEKALEYFDEGKVFERFESSLETSLIFVPKKFHLLLENHYIDEYSNEEKEEEFRKTLDLKITIRDLVKMGHTRGLPIISYAETRYLFEGEKNKIYLEFRKEYTQTSTPIFNRRVIFNPKLNSNIRLFLRNVLIKDFSFTPSPKLLIFDLINISINIFSKGFIPDISRNNFDISTTNDINYIIQKVIYKGIYDLFPLSGDEKVIIQKFTDKYFSQPTGLEKQI